MGIRSIGGALLPALLLLGGYAWRNKFCSDCMRSRTHWHPAPTIHTIIRLKVITTAQADFRVNDRDRDGANQYWRADIAGLYALTPGGGPAIRLIDESIALADARPLDGNQDPEKRRPCGGYWFRALRHADEGRLDALNRFAVECYPADYPRSGRRTYLVDERNTIFHADLGHGKGIDVFPTDEELKDQWTKLD